MDNKEYNRKYYEKKKKDPEWLEKRREKAREYSATLKERDPEQYKRNLENKKKREQEIRDFYKKNNK
jgi:hypothetical protein